MRENGYDGRQHAGLYNLLTHRVLHDELYTGDGDVPC